MEGNKCGNVLRDAPTDVHMHLHADPHIEKKYIIYNNSHIYCDKW